MPTFIVKAYLKVCDGRSYQRKVLLDGSKPILDVVDLIRRQMSANVVMR